MNPATPLLLVDDDLDLHETLKAFLQAEGFAVISAFNGEEALEHLQKRPLPHTILLDLMMPVMNGYDFLKLFQRETSFDSIQVVLLSAATDIAQVAKLHGVAFIKKPFDLEVLLAEVLKRS